MIVKVLRLVVLAVCTALTVAAAPVGVAWFLRDLPIPTEYKLTALWWVVCALIVGIGTGMVVVGVRRARRQRANGGIR